MREGSRSMSQMVKDEVGKQFAPDTLYIVDDFIKGEFYTKTGKIHRKILLYAFLIS